MIAVVIVIVGHMAVRLIPDIQVKRVKHANWAIKRKQHYIIDWVEAIYNVINRTLNDGVG